jgi:hypothetical protein
MQSQRACAPIHANALCPQEECFRAAALQNFSFSIYAHNFLSIERWREAATTDVRGLSQRHDVMATFTLVRFLTPSHRPISY